MTKFLTWHNIIPECTGKKNKTTTTIKLPAQTVSRAHRQRTSSGTIHQCLLVVPTPTLPVESAGKASCKTKTLFKHFHHQLTLFPSWVASSTFGPESFSLSGWGTRITLQVFLQSYCQSPDSASKRKQPSTVTYFAFLCIAAITTSQ